MASDRHFGNFLQGYLEFTQHMEAPTEFHLWTALSCISGALRGKAYIDMGYFKWKPNQFIIFVAPPGVVQKSTTSSVGMDLLSRVPGIYFGPNSMTWQAMTDSLAQNIESFEIDGKNVAMSCMTLDASELGSLLDFNNTEMVDVFVDLWDGKDKSWVRKTKGGGEESIPSPWINMIGATTPSWIQGNMPNYAIGGGFTSRCIFVYADKKENLIAYPDDKMPAGHKLLKKKLVDDLTTISKLTGGFSLTPEAKEFGTHWYNEFHSNYPKHLLDERMGGYIARKQTHMHKISMCLSAAERDDMVITKDHFETALSLLGTTEENMAKVFDAISENSDTKNLTLLKKQLLKGPAVGMNRRSLYCLLSSQMSLSGFEEAWNAIVAAGYAVEVNTGDSILLRASKALKEGNHYKASAEDRDKIQALKHK